MEGVVPRGPRVVQGEAPESDEESSESESVFNTIACISPVSVSAAPLHKNNDADALRRRVLESLVSGEASESDDEDGKLAVFETSSSLPVESGGGGGMKDAERRGSGNAALDRANSVNHNSLLHKKLREVNGRLSEHVRSVCGKEIEAGTKALRATSQQLSRTKLSMQESSNAMRLITNDLFQLEDKISIVASCTLLPDINIAVSAY